MANKPLIRAIGLKLPGPFLLCRKCLKRMSGGGKLRRRLKVGLKRRRTDQERARLLLTNCFGICPKGAVVTASAATLARDEVLLIHDGSEESIEQAIAALLDTPMA